MSNSNWSREAKYFLTYSAAFSSFNHHCWTKSIHDIDLIFDGEQGSDIDSKKLSLDNSEEVEQAESCLKERVAIGPKVSYGEEAL